MDLKSLQKIFNSKNLYYSGVALCLSIVLFLFGSLYTDNKAKNLKANLILNNADGVIISMKNQSNEIKKITTNYSSARPENLNKILNPNFKINDLTRYFDDLEQTFNANGTFEIGSLNYTGLETLNNYVDASINLTTSQTNLVDFLKFIEQTGFSNVDSKYLMEVRSINFSVPDLDPENPVQENYQATLVIRVYKFQ